MNSLQLAIENLTSPPVVAFALGALAAHYGSVSVVTFTAAIVFAREAGFAPEGYLATLVALLEIPGIIVALLLAVAAGEGTSLRAAVREVCTGRSVLLLVGVLVMGAVASDAAFVRVEPFFVGLFTGLLVLFLLDLGATAASRLREHRSLTPPVVAFGLVTPLILGATGVAVGTLAGLSPGGAGGLRRDDRERVVHRRTRGGARGPSQRRRRTVDRAVARGDVSVQPGDRDSPLPRAGPGHRLLDVSVDRDGRPGGPAPD